MSLSTVIVAINSQTLRKYEPKIAEFKEKKHLTKDPVCGMEVQPEKAYTKVEHEEYVIYFCSEECEKEFTKNPKEYLTKIKMEKPPKKHEYHAHH